MEKVVKKEKQEKHRCSQCKSMFGYFRIKDKSYTCRSCGFVDKEVDL